MSAGRRAVWKIKMKFPPGNGFFKLYGRLVTCYYTFSERYQILLLLAVI